MNVRKNIKKKFPPSPKTDLGGGGGGGGGRGPGYASGPGNSGQGDVPACRDLGTQVPPGIDEEQSHLSKNLMSEIGRRKDSPKVFKS